MNRRGFLGAILASAAAPAIVKAGILMPVRAVFAPEPVLLIGRHADFRFIETPHDHAADAMGYVVIAHPDVAAAWRRELGATPAWLHDAPALPAFQGEVGYWGRGFVGADEYRAEQERANRAARRFMDKLSSSR